MPGNKPGDPHYLASCGRQGRVPHTGNVPGAVQTRCRSETGATSKSGRLARGHLSRSDSQEGCGAPAPFATSLIRLGRRHGRQEDLGQPLTSQSLSVHLWSMCKTGSGDVAMDVIGEKEGDLYG